MSDWTDEIQNYEENNWEDLALEFIEKHDKLWSEFVSDKFFSGGMNERFNEDR
jgi:hypothetical protein